MTNRREELAARLQECKRPLVAYVYHLVWNKRDFEDALQHVLVQVVSSHERYEESGKFRSWLFRIATLATYSFNRSRSFEEAPVEASDVVVEAPDAQLTLEDAYQDALADPNGLVRRFSAEIRSAFGGLNPSEKRVFLLRAMGDLTYREISAALDIPIGSVMGHLSRARVKLRRALARSFEERRREM